MVTADQDLRAYTVAMAQLLGIELDDDEIDPVVTQVERVGDLVSRLPRQQQQRPVRPSDRWPACPLRSRTSTI